MLVNHQLSSKALKDVDAGLACDSNAADVDTTIEVNQGQQYSKADHLLVITA